jgi:hypothetical protein
MPPLVFVLGHIGLAALLLDGALLAWGSPGIYGVGIPLRSGSEELVLPLTEELPREARGLQATWIGDGRVGYFSNSVRIGFRANGMRLLPAALQRAISGMGVPASGVLRVSEDGRSVVYREVLRLGPLILILCLMGAAVSMFSQGEVDLPLAASLFPIVFFGLFFGVFGAVGLGFLGSARRTLAGGAF